MLLIDDQSQTVRPVQREDDVTYGLLPGTNGTGAEMRRRLSAPVSYTWLTSEGRSALGILYTPSTNTWFNPWR